MEVFDIESIVFQDIESKGTIIYFVDTMTERQILLMTYFLRQSNDNMFCRHNDKETDSFNDILRQKTGEHRMIVRC